MNSSFSFEAAVGLCASDFISGFISAKPVIESCENITVNRISQLHEMVSQIRKDLLDKMSDEPVERIDYCLKKAIHLTRADITCGVIAIEPILCDRDTLIRDTISNYFSMIWSLFEKHDIRLIKNESITVCHQQISSAEVAIKHQDVVIPVYHKMKSAKKKKGKR